MTATPLIVRIVRRGPRMGSQSVSPGEWIPAAACEAAADSAYLRLPVGARPVIRASTWAYYLDWRERKEGTG
jgi:hypothetical protein